MAKGIIISGGGRYLLCALVNIRILREHGCKLPIELWHFKKERLPARAHRTVSTWGVTLRELPELPASYASKPYAIVHSHFEEVLVIDADNTPIRNPEYLFDSKAYKETGAIFWPDFEWAPANEAWSQLANRCHPLKARQQESGQLVIDKSRCQEAILKTLDFNYRYHEISEHLWGAKGDKDTYQLAWHSMEQPFHMIPYYPGSAGRLVEGEYHSNTMVQHDPSGKPLFMHKNSLKWHLVRKEDRYWDVCIFTKDPAAEDIRYEIFGDSKGHRHQLLPKERTEQVEARKVIADLETKCLDWITKIRNTYWYKEAVFHFYCRDYLGRILKRN